MYTTRRVHCGAVGGGMIHWALQCSRAADPTTVPTGSCGPCAHPVPTVPTGSYGPCAHPRSCGVVRIVCPSEILWGRTDRVPIRGPVGSYGPCAHPVPTGGPADLCAHPDPTASSGVVRAHPVPTASSGVVRAHPVPTGFMCAHPVPTGRSCGPLCARPVRP